MPNGPSHFVWYELMTPDPDAAKLFYDAVVGWNIEPQSSFPNGYRMIGRSDGKNAGGILPLTEDMKAHGARPAWVGYLGVDDVDRVLGAVESAGGRSLMPPFDIQHVGRVAMVADPDGAPLYLMRPTPPPGQPDAESDVFSVDQPQHVRWNELSTTDPAGAITFYTKLFGWRQEGEMDMGEFGTYSFIYRDQVMIGAIMPRMPQMPASMWTYYIGVDDIDRALAAVNDGGGQILHGPQEIPGGEYSLNGMDSQGAAFALVGPRRS